MSIYVMVEGVIIRTAYRDSSCCWVVVDLR